MAHLKTTINRPNGVTDEPVTTADEAILVVNKPTSINSSLSVGGAVTFVSGGSPSSISVVSGAITLGHINNSVTLANAASGAFTITLPSAQTQAGTHLFVKKIDSTLNIVTVAASGSQLIDGQSNQQISDQYVSLHIVSYLTNWWII